LHVNDALAYISKERSGVFLLIRPHEASSDVKTYGVGAQILSDLGVGKMRILGSPRKLNALKGFGLEVVEYITGRNRQDLCTNTIGLNIATGFVWTNKQKHTTALLTNICQRIINMQRFGVFLWAHLKKMSRLTNRMV
jgi:hypothetical protein